jgi:hypothetical protein
MAIASAFRDLHVHVEKLHGALLGLRLTTVEDKPLRDEAALADAFGDATEDLLGWVKEALDAAAEGHRACEKPVDLERAARALATCHEAHNRIEQKLCSELMSYERISAISRIGRERRGEWLAWSKSVRQALDRCQTPLYNVSRALVLCWQEVAERIGMTSLSVQATNIGQQISVPKGRKLRAEGYLEAPRG